jgi:hypothetical protein
MTKQQAKFRKNGYRRAARLCKKSGYSLRRSDVMRALHYRAIEQSISE